MAKKPRISIGIADYYKPGKYFTVVLKDEIKQQHCLVRKAGKVMVVSNVNGGFLVLAKTLIGKKVVDNHLNWIYEDGHLVVLGNVIADDYRGEECLWLIYSLEEQARLAGGGVHFLPGSNELDFFSHRGLHKHPSYAEKGLREGMRGGAAALYDGSAELIRWMRTKNIFERVGETLFLSKFAVVDLLQEESHAREMIKLLGETRSFVVPPNRAQIHHYLERMIRAGRENKTMTFTNDMVQIIFNATGCSRFFVTETGAMGIKLFGVPTVVDVGVGRSGDLVCLLIKKEQLYSLKLGMPVARLDFGLPA